MRTINNKLIAEFLGYKPETKKAIGATLNQSFYKWYIKDMDYYNIDGGLVDEFNLRFDTDWNWLMKAVDKINGLNNVVSINENHVIITNNTKSDIIAEVVAGNMIEATYEAVIEFINFYNKQKQ